MNWLHDDIMTKRKISLDSRISNAFEFFFQQSEETQLKAHIDKSQEEWG